MSDQDTPLAGWDFLHLFAEQMATESGINAGFNRLPPLLEMLNDLTFVKREETEPENETEAEQKEAKVDAQEVFRQATVLLVTCVCALLQASVRQDQRISLCEMKSCFAAGTPAFLDMVLYMTGQGTKHQEGSAKAFNQKIEDARQASAERLRDKINEAKAARTKL